MRYVVAQFVLIAAIAIGWLFPPRPGHETIGAVLAIAGALLAAWTTRTLGPALTPHPVPRGPLVTGGPYRWVRHPMYVAGTLLCVGVSLALSWASLALTAVLVAVWVAKARVEERNLAARFPEYEEYRRTTLF